MATLNVTTKIVAYADETASSNPRLKFVDWIRNQSSVAVANPRSEAFTLAPGTSKVVFDGSLASTIDGTTAFSLALSTIEGSRYRITHTGGTAPGFRTGRNLTLNGTTLTWVVNSNSTVTVTCSGGSDFTNLLVGDEVFVPHTTTGDAANVLSVLNAGYWSVLAKASATSITLVRPAGTDFEATAQAVALTANSQFRGYSASGLQIGDFVDISAGFAAVTRKNYEVLAVTDSFIEVVSTVALPSETGIQPGATGMLLYSEAKKFLYVESNQEAVIRVNGDVGSFQRIAPFDASDSNSVGTYQRAGLTWSLTLVNNGVTSASMVVIYGE